MYSNLDRPVFITGCGRSGTTILGEALSHHPAITYLNEPREIWEQAYPETDIWSEEASRRGGRLHLDQRDCLLRKSEKLGDGFRKQVLLAGKTRLVEKLPENNFRLEFIRAIFPNALFLHIVRNGIEVARSISRACKDSRASGPEWPYWFGVDDYKWKQLVEYSRRFDDYKNLPDLCKTEFDRGLLEWRLSVEAALRFSESVPSDSYLQISYENLLSSPVEVMKQVERFIKVAPAEPVYAFALVRVERKSPKAFSDDITQRSALIAGGLLRRLGYQYSD